jgi:hypothetical protein
VHLAFGLRHAFILPLVVVQPWAVLFPAAAVGAYEAAWRVRPSNPIWLAELATGAIWGGLILAM